MTRGCGSTTNTVHDDDDDVDGSPSLGWWELEGVGVEGPKSSEKSKSWEVEVGGEEEDDGMVSLLSLEAKRECKPFFCEEDTMFGFGLRSSATTTRARACRRLQTGQRAKVYISTA